MFYLIFLIGIAYLFIGGIIGENYRYTIASIILFLITLKLNIGGSAWAMGFTALFGIIIFTAVVFLLAIVVIGGADLIKNGILN